MSGKISFNICLAICVLLLVLAGQAAADTHYVVPGQSIQAAIDAAVNGDEVVVADGTYTGAGNTNLNFGGRLITLRSENGPYACIIDCEHAADGLYFVSDESELAVVQGVTIQNAMSMGAVHISNSSPAVMDCRFINNTGTFGGAIYMYFSQSRIIDCVFIGNTSSDIGGGIHARISNPTIVNCHFLGNSGKWGGGLASYVSNSTVIGCTFSGNTAEHEGGGLYSEGDQLKAADCLFTGNRAATSGGGISVYQGSANVKDSHFIGNAATEAKLAPDSGGAMNNCNTTNVSVENCLFSGNYAFGIGALNSASCGAIKNYNAGAVTITDCLFVGNAAHGDESLTGTCGGVSNSENTVCTVSNCILADNDPGTYAWGSLSRSTVCNSIMWNPRAVYRPLECWGCTVTYSNVRLETAGEGNISSDPNFAGGPSGTFTADGVYDPPTYTIMLTDADAEWIPGEMAGKFIMPYISPFDTSGRIFVFPIIANTSDTMTIHADWKTIADGVCWITGGAPYYIRDYHLKPGSDSIDKGDPNFVPEPEQADLDGFSRLVDGDCDQTSRVDMGAYEFNYAYIGDLDYNCGVDFFDFSILGSAWMTRPPDAQWNHLYDISNPADNFIDWRDLAILGDNWLAQVP